MLELRSPQGLRYTVDPDVYDPHDDTWMLVDAIRTGRGERFLEVGCGAGLAAIRAARDGARVLATDVNPRALQLTRRNAGLNRVVLDVARADLLGGIRRNMFDAVAFNPPYLPTAAEDRLGGRLEAAFTGGENGRATTERFIDVMTRHRIPRAWLVASSLQNPPDLEQKAKDRGFRVRAVSSKRLSFESLTVYELSVS